MSERQILISPTCGEMPGAPRRRVRVIVMLAVIGLAGCMHSPPKSSDTAAQDTGAFASDDDGHRETVLIEPKEGADTEYDIRPAVFDTALIRVEDHDVAGSTVEVLIKGSFPDGCSELNELDQQPTRNGQEVTLSMRRPADAICTQVVRPYRFFFTLDRRFEPGRYVLSVNGKSFNFQVASGRDDA